MHPNVSQMHLMFVYLLCINECAAFLEKYGIKKRKIETPESTTKTNEATENFAVLASSLFNSPAKKLLELAENLSTPQNPSPSPFPSDHIDQSKQPSKQFSESTLEHNLASLSCEQRELVEAALDGKNVFFTGTVEIHFTKRTNIFLIPLVYILHRFGWNGEIFYSSDNDSCTTTSRKKSGRYGTDWGGSDANKRMYVTLVRQSRNRKPSTCHSSK
jgi:hypothetical protein